MQSSMLFLFYKKILYEIIKYISDYFGNQCNKYYNEFTKKDSF